MQDLRYNLSQSCSWMNNLSRKFLSPFGITPKQYNILAILHGKGDESCSIQEVRDSLADKMSDASRLIDRLEKKGLLDKFPSDFDRRSNRARISARGRQLLDRISVQRRSFDQEVGKRLSGAEVKQLNQLLSRLK